MEENVFDEEIPCDFLILILSNLGGMLGLASSLESDAGTQRLEDPRQAARRPLAGLLVN